MSKPHRPSNSLSTLVVVVLTTAWCYVRLVLFDDAILPLTFVLPLLVCLWTQRHWQLWSMAAVFIVAAGVKTFLLLPSAPTWTPIIAPFGATFFNVLPHDMSQHKRPIGQA